MYRESRDIFVKVSFVPYSHLEQFRVATPAYECKVNAIIFQRKVISITNKVSGFPRQNLSVIFIPPSTFSMDHIVLSIRLKNATDANPYNDFAVPVSFRVLVIYTISLCLLF